MTSRTVRQIFQPFTQGRRIDDAKVRGAGDGTGDQPPLAPGGEYARRGSCGSQRFRAGEHFTVVVDPGPWIPSACSNALGSPAAEPEFAPPTFLPSGCRPGSPGRDSPDNQVLIRLPEIGARGNWPMMAASGRSGAGRESAGSPFDSGVHGHAEAGTRRLRGDAQVAESGVRAGRSLRSPPTRWVRDKQRLEAVANDYASKPIRPPAGSSRKLIEQLSRSNRSARAS